jgi:glycosyltransferase involved in cell wall biosynthesis
MTRASGEQVDRAVLSDAESMTLVRTRGCGSIDKYAGALASHLSIRTLDTEIFERSIERWEQGWISRATIQSAAWDAKLLSRLRAAPGPLHLTNHHLGRYGCFLKAPFVITVHDLIRLFDLSRADPLIHRPNSRARFYLKLDYRGVRRAERLIAVSNTTKQDLVDHLDIEPARIDVVYHGVDREIYRPSRRRLNGRPYVLFVGTEQPRKNFSRVLEAFARLKSHRSRKDIELVKIGGEGHPAGLFRPGTTASMKRLGLENHVRFKGWVSEADLAAYYSGAICCVLPSLSEGFGLPVLEAMACGCPVVTTETTATGEVAADAAAYVDPLDADSIADAIAALIDAPGLRADLSRRGLGRAAAFSWERTALETEKVYRRLLDGQERKPSLSRRFKGVSDGTRTHDHLDHNSAEWPELT